MSRRRSTNILSYSNYGYSNFSETDQNLDSSDFYSKGSKNEDKVLINLSGKGIEVDMDIFRSVIEKLKDHSSTPVSMLDEDTSDKYNTVVTFINIASNDYHIYDRFVKIIREVFSDIKTIKPGTIGSYFLGNLQDFDKSYGSYNGPSNCHPLKIGAAPNTNGQTSNCQYPAFIFAHGKFTRQNNVNGSIAVIYVDRPSFQGFTTQNIIDLQSIGINSAYLNYGINSDEAIESTPHPINIQSLPLQNSSSNDTGSSKSTIIILIIILLLLILFLGFMFFKRSSVEDVNNMKIVEKEVAVMNNRSVIPKKSYNRNYVSSSPRFNDRYDFVRNRPVFDDSPRK